MSNILSIDFDYFLTGEVGQRTEYSPQMSNNFMDWMRYYNRHFEHFQTEVREEDIDLLLHYLFQIDHNTPIVIADSHEQIVAAMEHVGLWSHDKYDVYNLDHHHDIHYGTIPDATGFGCANWVHYLHLHQKVSRYIWIRNPDSSLYTEEHRRLGFPLEETTDIDAIRKKEYKMVFLCRSSAWVPPHLYSAFDELMMILPLYFRNIHFLEDHVISPHLHPDNYDRERIYRLITRYKKIAGDAAKGFKLPS